MTKSLKKNSKRPIDKDPEQKREDDVLGPKLNTPPKPHKPKMDGGKRSPAKS